MPAAVWALGAAVAGSATEWTAGGAPPLLPHADAPARPAALRRLDLSGCPASLVRAAFAEALRGPPVLEVRVNWRSFRLS